MSLYAGNNTYTEGVCLPFQRQLADLKKQKAPEVRRETEYYGFLQAVNSPGNKQAAGIELVNIDPAGSGHTNSVRVKYLQRMPQGQSITTHNTSCEAEVARKPLHEDVTVGQYLRTQNIIIPTGEVRKLCAGEGSTWMQRQVAALLDGYAKDLNLKLMQIAVANVGEYADGTTSKNFQVLNADGSSRPYGEAEMRKALGKAGFIGTPIVVGEGLFWNYYQNQMIGAVQDTGFRIDSTAKFNMYTDWNAGHSTVFNDENAVFIMEPGMVQLLTFNQYVGDYAYTLGQRGPTEHMTIFDDVTGLTYDWRLAWNECGDNSNGQWEVQISLCYDMWFRPSDAYEATDTMNWVNYLFKGVGTQAS